MPDKTFTCPNCKKKTVSFKDKFKVLSKQVVTCSECNATFNRSLLHKIIIVLYLVGIITILIAFRENKPFQITYILSSALITLILYFLAPLSTIDK